MRAVCFSALTAVAMFLSTTPPVAHAAPTGQDCGTVTGTPWRTPGNQPLTGDQYQVVAVKVGCAGARSLAAYESSLPLDHPLRKFKGGWRCRRSKTSAVAIDASGTCNRIVRRKVRASVFWYTAPQP